MVKTNTEEKKLEAMKLKKITDMENDSLERLVPEIQSRIRIVGSFVEDESALMLVAARSNTSSERNRERGII